MHTAVHTDAQRNRDRSAVALWRSGKDVTDNGIARLADIQFIEQGIVRRFQFLLFKNCRFGQHSTLRCLAGRQFLLRDRPLGDRVRAGKSQRSYQRKDAQAYAQLQHFTHGFSPPRTTWDALRAQ